MIRNNSGAEPDETLRRAVVEDFNRMLQDRNFSRDFIERTDGKPRDFARFNKRLFLQRFRKYLPAEGLFVPGASPRYMEDAGFRLVMAFHDILPFEDIDIFGADKRTGSDGR